MKIADDLVIYEVVIKQNLRAFLDIVLFLLLRKSYFIGEQGWRSGESVHVPPMWPGFKSSPVP